MIEEARARRLRRDLRLRAVYEVVDALPLARHADDVVVVVRLGQTRIDRVLQLAELLPKTGSSRSASRSSAPRGPEGRLPLLRGVSGPETRGPDQRSRASSSASAEAGGRPPESIRPAGTGRWR